MRRLVIEAHGDNDALHARALQAAIEAVEHVNGARVVRAWVARPDEQLQQMREAIEQAIAAGMSAAKFEADMTRLREHVGTSESSVRGLLDGVERLAEKSRPRQAIGGDDSALAHTLLARSNVALDRAREFLSAASSGDKDRSALAANALQAALEDVGR